MCPLRLNKVCISGGGVEMAKCAVCGKGMSIGNSTSHSNVKTKRKWSPNLQHVKAIVDGSTKKIDVCTRCLRSGKVQRAI
jgi:large subunit ribosomal protein L28